MHRPPVELDQLAHESEPQAEPGLSAGGGAFGLTETLEHERQELTGEAAAGIAHDDVNLVADADDRSLDVATRGREFDGVEKQVPENLLHSVEIAEHDARMTIAR